LKYEEIIRDLKNKVYHPVYLLCGEEEYFIDMISDYIEDHVLEESEKEFNQSVLYGMETDVQALIAEAKRYPMMASYNVVIVKEAQNLKKIEELASYAKNPSKTTILVLNHKHKKADGRSALTKAVKKDGVYFESKSLYENQVPEWIDSYIKNKGMAITPKAKQLLVEFLGTDLSKIANELNKLVLSLEKGSEIDPLTIEKNIGISKDYNVFELNNALGMRDVVRANKIINHFGKNSKEHPMPMLLPMIYRYFSQVLLYHTVANADRNKIAATLGINPFFVKDYVQAAKNYPVKKVARIISALRDVDVRSKGVGGTDIEDQELMKELIYKIIH
jgi:DNA polymerase-3 subunit delta